MNLEREIRDLHAELYAKGTIPCVLAGRNVRATECCSRSLAASAEDFRRCLSCRRGHELAATSGIAPRGLLPLAEQPVYGDDRPRQIRPMPTMLARIIAPRPVVPAAKPAPAPKRAAKAPRPKRQPKPAPAPVAVAAPVAKAPKPAPAPRAKPTQPPLQKPVVEATPQEPKRWAWKDEPKARPKVKARPVSIPEATPPAPAVPVEAPVAVPSAEPVVEALPYSLVKLAAVLRELTSDGRLRVTMLDIQRALRAPTYDAAAALVMQARLRTSRLVGPVETVIVDNTMRELLARAKDCQVLQ